jgi:osmotically-inducible protein OsmY
MTTCSDTEIVAAARLALDAGSTVLAATVRVHVDDGIVWLMGRARAMSEQYVAERIVRGVDGVRDVVNSIVVMRSREAGEFGANE